MKTLADLKRELNVGDSVTLIESPFYHKWINVKRYVVKKQSNGVYLSQDPTDTKGSYLEFKNAKLTEYDGKEIRTYSAGIRELTEQEKSVYSNRPSARKENEEQAVIEMLTDGSGLFYKDKQYFKDHGMKYFIESGQTKKFNAHNKTVTDEQIKGNLELRYIIEKRNN